LTLAERDGGRDLERGGVDHRDRIPLGVADEQAGGGSRQGAERDDDDGEQAGDAPGPHGCSSRRAQGAVFSIAVMARFGGVPRNVNRTASPTLTDSTIFGVAVRKPIVMAGM